MAKKHKVPSEIKATSRYQAMLQLHFAGTVYQRGQRTFEQFMYYFIRKNMMVRYPLTDDYIQKMKQIDNLDKKDELRKEVLQKEIDVAEEVAAAAKQNFMKNKTDSTLRQAMIDARSKEREVRKRVGKEIKLMDNAKEVRHKTKPNPAWIEAVRGAFPPNSNMRKFITVDSQFDMYTITKILQHFFQDVFRVVIGCSEYDVQVASLLERIQRATHLRNLRSHIYFDQEKQMPTESEVLDGLATMRRIMLLCKVSDGAEQLDTIISESQDLYDKSANSGVDNFTPKCVKVAITKDELRRHFLYTSLIEFESELTRQVGRVHIDSGHYVIKDDTSSWSEKRRQRFESRKGDFRTIVIARNKFAHNNPLGDDNDKDGVTKILETMGKILHYLKGLKHHLPKSKWGGLPPTWTNHTAYQTLLENVCDDKVEIQVKLVRSRGRMTIPIPPDDYFTGREEDVRQVTDGLMRKGARVLVHGTSGVGKSTLVAEVIRSDEINSCEDIILVGWIGGSTEQSLQTDLIELFNTHHREVIDELETNEERLRAIEKWLQTNDGWLFAVDDATSEVQTLSRCILNSPHGRVIITSKEKLDQSIGHQSVSVKTTLTVRLQPLSTLSCLEIWKSMNLFGVSQQELQDISEKENIEDDLKSRCKLTQDNPHLSVVTYVSPTTDEKPQDRKQRHRKMVSALREFEELTTPGLSDFFEESLGNLPVSVRLVGNMIRTSGGE